MKKTLIILLSIISLNSFSQTDSTKHSIRFSGYIEAYYAFDFGNPDDHNRPWFMYSHNRHNEININLGFLKAVYETKKVRANLALMTGTYANANLASEPGVLKNIYEGNIGVKISKTKNLWIDAGIFASHIGFESAIGKDCWTLTRSIQAENSPYYESGAKISFTSKNEKWFISGLILNGWQRIQRVHDNNTPAFGHQVTYTPSSKMMLNSSSFIGSDTPDSSRQMRYFHNFYGKFQVHKKWGLILGFDIGTQQKNKGSKAYNIWYSPIVIAKFSPTPKLSIAARCEYYSDVNGVIIYAPTPHGFQTFGYSVNLDYALSENLVWRIEGRGLESKDKLFTFNGKPGNSNYFVTTALALSF